MQKPLPSPPIAGWGGRGLGGAAPQGLPKVLHVGRGGGKDREVGGGYWWDDACAAEAWLGRPQQEAVEAAEEKLSSVPDVVQSLVVLHAEVRVLHADGCIGKAGETSVLVAKRVSSAGGTDEKGRLDGGLLTWHADLLLGTRGG